MNVDLLDGAVPLCASTQKRNNALVTRTHMEVDPYVCCGFWGRPGLWRVMDWSGVSFSSLENGMYHCRASGKYIVMNV